MQRNVFVSAGWCVGQKLNTNVREKNVVNLTEAAVFTVFTRI